MVTGILFIGVGSLALALAQAWATSGGFRTSRCLSVWVVAAVLAGAFSMRFFKLRSCAGPRDGLVRGEPGRILDRCFCLALTDSLGE
jgi:hypothetical protein